MPRTSGCGAKRGAGGARPPASQRTPLRIRRTQFVRRPGDVMNLRQWIAVAALALLGPVHVSAQVAAAPGVLGTPRAIVDAAIDKVKAHYVFPEVASRVETALKKTTRSDKNFASAEEARAFAQQLT